MDFSTYESDEAMAAALQAAEYQNAGMAVPPAGPFSTMYAASPPVAAVPRPQHSAIPIRSRIYPGFAPEAAHMRAPKATAPAAVNIDPTASSSPGLAWPSIINAPTSPFSGLHGLVEVQDESFRSHLFQATTASRRMSGGEPSSLSGSGGVTATVRGLAAPAGNTTTSAVAPVPFPSYVPAGGAALRATSTSRAAVTMDTRLNTLESLEPAATAAPIVTASASPATAVNRPMLRLKPSFARPAPTHAATRINNAHHDAPADPPEVSTTRSAPINRSPFIQNLVHSAHVAHASQATRTFPRPTAATTTTGARVGIPIATRTHAPGATQVEVRPCFTASSLNPLPPARGTAAPVAPPLSEFFRKAAAAAVMDGDDAPLVDPDAVLPLAYAAPAPLRASPGASTQATATTTVGLGASSMGSAAYDSSGSGAPLGTVMALRRALEAKASTRPVPVPVPVPIVSGVTGTLGSPDDDDGDDDGPVPAPRHISSTSTLRNGTRPGVPVVRKASPGAPTFANAIVTPKKSSPSPSPGVTDQRRMYLSRAAAGQFPPSRAFILGLTPSQPSDRTTNNVNSLRELMRPSEYGRGSGSAFGHEAGSLPLRRYAPAPTGVPSSSSSTSTFGAPVSGYNTAGGHIGGRVPTTIPGILELIEREERRTVRKAPQRKPVLTDREAMHMSAEEIFARFSALDEHSAQEKVNAQLPERKRLFRAAAAVWRSHIPGAKRGEETEECCVVCYDDRASEAIPRRLLCILPCTHAFHVDCIRGWALSDPHESPGCPVCKTGLFH